MRTTRSKVTFQSAFNLNNVVGELPAGTYDLEVDEEPVGGAGSSAFRRVMTLLVVRSGGTIRTLQVDHKHLQAALERDEHSKTSA
jgi:hypothetical protein